MMEGLKGGVAEHEAFTEQELRAHRTGEGEEKEWRSSLLKLSSFIITQTWKAHIWLRTLLLLGVQTGRWGWRKLLASSYPSSLLATPILFKQRSNLHIILMTTEQLSIHRRVQFARLLWAKWRRLSTARSSGQSFLHVWCSHACERTDEEHKQDEH